MEKNIKVLRKEYKTTRILINDLLMVSREEKMVFRGIKDFSELNPSINRVRTSYEETSNLESMEFNLLYQFKKHATSYLNGNLDILDIVAYAQHFGLPTRLIDWTRNPFVALYFAINRSKENQPVYIFYTNLVDNTLLNRSYAGFRHIDLENGKEFIMDYKIFIDSIKDREILKEHVKTRSLDLENIGIIDDSTVNDNGLIFYECNSSNPRLIAQQGLFSIPISIENDNAKREILDNTNFIKILLNADEKQELLKYLKNMNYNGIRLFPDVQSICLNIVSDLLSRG